MVTENAEIAHADAKSNSKSGDLRRWLRGLLLPSILIVAVSFGHVMAVFGAAVVLAISIELILSRFPSRRVMYACSLAVLLFAGVFTLGIVGHTKSVPSSVTGMFSQDGWWFGSEDYCVIVTCDEARSGDVMAIVHRGDYERILSQDWNEDNQYPVELTYRTESILGISGLPPVAEAIDSKRVISDYRDSLRGGIVGRVVFPITLVLGALPLAYLVYKDRKDLFGRRSRR
ncbi:MAG: hypothetical protein NTU41_11740 [Chloroflexi bacterium]|nr:hypothetical protein [Chloroflexota bacterium]